MARMNVGKLRELLSKLKKKARYHAWRKNVAMRSRIRLGRSKARQSYLKNPKRYERMGLATEIGAGLYGGYALKKRIRKKKKKD